MQILLANGTCISPDSRADGTYCLKSAIFYIHTINFFNMPAFVFRSLGVTSLCLVLSACAVVMPPAQVTSEVAEQWHAPLPHHGAVAELSHWWQQQGDAVLVDFIQAAQQVSPTLAAAVSRVEAARASQVTAGAVLLPQVSATLGAGRGVSQPAVPVATSLQGGFQAAWELDLVGANRAVSRAALAQLEGSQAQWHDARVSIAAEVALVYYGLSSCYKQLQVLHKDALSRGQTAQVAELGVKAGFVAAPVAALARASAAEGRARESQQAAACDISIKALVALTGLPEPQVREKMISAQAAAAPVIGLAIGSVPAQTIAQRPDIYVAERDVVVASAQVGSAKAQRYPRLTLNGSVGTLRYSSMGVNTDLDTWSFGPLALNLPIFDGGQRAANVDLAQKRYTEAVSVYRAKVRQAVREVEETLVNLQSIQARALDADIAAKGYAESLQATHTRYAQGFASLTDLEESRRITLAAEFALLSLDLERKRAWVALYRALGGGFVPQSDSI